MKKFFLFTLYGILLSLAFGCSKDLDFGNDYKFELKEANATPFIKDQYKDINVSLFDVFGKEKAAYSISYKNTTGLANISVDGFELTESAFHPITFTDDKASIKVKATSLGLVNLTVFLQDSNGIVKEQKMQISTDTFDFTATSVATSNPVFVSSAAPIALNIVNTGANASSVYQIKYTSDQSGTFTVGATTLVSNTFITIASGQSLANYTTNIVGLHNVTLTVKNSQGIQKIITLSFDFLPTTAAISFPLSPLPVKQTIVKTFQMNRTNLISTYTYQIKFACDKNCQIFDALDNPIALNTYVSIPSTNGSFTYKFLTNQSQDAILTVSLKNQLTTVVDKILLIEVNPSPVLGSYTALHFGTSLSFTFGDIFLGTGETVAQYELNVFNQNNILIGTFNTPIVQVTNAFGTYFYFTARVKDSSGRWSNFLTDGFINF